MPRYTGPTITLDERLRWPPPEDPNAPYIPPRLPQPLYSTPQEQQDVELAMQGAPEPTLGELIRRKGREFAERFRPTAPELGPQAIEAFGGTAYRTPEIVPKFVQRMLPGGEAVAGAIGGMFEPLVDPNYPAGVTGAVQRAGALIGGRKGATPEDIAMGALGLALPLPGGGRVAARVAAPALREMGPAAARVGVRAGEAVAGAMRETVRPGARRIAEGRRVPAAIRPGTKGYPPGREAALERIAELEDTLIRHNEAAKQGRTVIHPDRMEDFQNELADLRYFVGQEPGPTYADLALRARQTGAPSISALRPPSSRGSRPHERGLQAAEVPSEAQTRLLERGEQIGFGGERVPFETEIRPELLPEKALEGVQPRIPGLGEGFYIPPGLSKQEEELLRKAVARGDRKTIKRLTAKGQGQLMEERLPYQANGTYELSPDAITTNPLHQPRKGLDEANVRRIVETYDPNRFQPVEVRELNPGVFELIHGHHRLEAARRLKLDRIPARVLNVSSSEAIRLAEEANLAGQPLKPSEIARVLDRRLRMVEAPEQIVKAFPGAGIRANQVEDYARIVNLPRVALEALDDPVLGKQFSLQHAMRLAKAQAKYSMPADEVQAFFNEIIMKQDITPAQLERILDSFAPVIRKEAEAQGSLFGGDFGGSYTGIMATIRNAVGDIKGMESLERRLKGIVGFIKAGEEVPAELRAAQEPLERQVAAIRGRIVQAQKAVTGQIRSEPRAAAQPAAAEAARETWQMTYKEYSASPISDTALGRKWGEHNVHYQAIQAALKAKKPVPPEVLADYPDLARAAPGAARPEVLEGQVLLTGASPKELIQALTEAEANVLRLNRGNITDILEKLRMTKQQRGVGDESYLAALERIQEVQQRRPYPSISRLQQEIWRPELPPAAIEPAVARPGVSGGIVGEAVRPEVHGGFNIGDDVYVHAKSGGEITAWARITGFTPEGQALLVGNDLKPFKESVDIAQLSLESKARVARPSVSGAVVGEGVPPTVPPTGGKPPPPPGHVPPGGGFDRVMRMWKDQDKAPSLEQRFTAFKAAVPRLYEGVQAATTDRLAAVNGLTGRMRKARKAQGLDLPDELNAEALAALVPGSGEAGMQRIRGVLGDVKAIMGKPWPDAEDHLNTYLSMKHAIDIEAAKGAQRLIPGGIKGAREAQETLNQMQAYLGPERWARLQDMSQAVVQHQNQLLDDMVSEGLVSAKLAEVLKRQYPHYIKTQIIQDAGDMLSGTISAKRLSVSSNNLRRLTEEGTEKARYRPLDSLKESLMQGEALLARNRAARAIGELAVQDGIGKRIAGTKKVAEVEGEAVFRRPPGEQKNTISYFEKGQRVMVQVPENLYRAAQVLMESPDPNVIQRFLGIVQAIPKNLFVTYNPTWPAANFVIDGFTAMMQGVPPQEIGRGLVGAIRDIGGKDPMLARMRASGAGQTGWFARSPEEVRKLAEKEAGNVFAITTPLDHAKFMANPLNAIGRIAEGQQNVGRAFELATRRAAFTTALKRGATEQQAALTARRITIDFSRAGYAVRQANFAYLFLNAGVQGTLLPFRALRDNPATRWGLAATLGAVTATYAHNRQFPEYEDVPRDLRYGSWVVMLPSKENDANGKPKPNYLTVIPRTREWGLFIGPAIYALEKLDEKAQPDFGEFLKTLAPQVQPIEGPTAIIPTQIGQTIMEAGLNRDFYRNRPIVPPEQEGLPPEEQHNEYTSETIKRIAQALGLSPLKVQHAFYGMTGGGGRAILQTTDWLLERMDPRPEDWRIAQLAHEYDEITGDDMAVQRKEFLASLDVKDQEAVLQQARKRGETIPVLDRLLARFYQERGGELRRLGQEAAEKQTGLSAKQTADMGRALGGFYEDERKRGEDEETAVLARWSDPNVRVAFREAQRDAAIRYQGALSLARVLFPRAAQLEDKKTWQDYLTQIHTIADTMADDRTRGQLLAAGYRAIPLEHLDPLSPDFKVFFQKRKEYEAALSEDALKLMRREMMASMTKTERLLFEDKKSLEPYWEIEDRVDEAIPVRKDAPAGSEGAKSREADIEFNRKAYLRKHPEADKAHQTWYGAKPVEEEKKPEGPEFHSPGTEGDWKNRVTLMALQVLEPGTKRQTYNQLTQQEKDQLEPWLRSLNTIAYSATKGKYDTFAEAAKRNPQWANAMQAAVLPSLLKSLKKQERVILP